MHTYMSCVDGDGMGMMKNGVGGGRGQYPPQSIAAKQEEQ